MRCDAIDGRMRRTGGRGPTTTTMSTWEELRKDARRCESAIERELGELARLGTTTTTTNDDVMLERLNARSNERND